MEIKARARIRKMLEGIDAASPGDDEALTLTPQLELLVAPSAAIYREVVRAGRAFWVTNVTAVAAVVAPPTTTQNLALYNGEPDGGRSYVIDWVAGQNVVSTGVAGQAQMLVLQGQVREAVPTSAGLGIRKANSLGSAVADGSSIGADTRAVTTIATGTALPATTGLAANWIPFGAATQKPGVTAVGGYGLFVPVDGRIICPPGRYFAVQVIANVVGETFITSIGWHEVQTVVG